MRVDRFPSAPDMFMVATFEHPGSAGVFVVREKGVTAYSALARESPGTGTGGSEWNGGVMSQHHRSTRAGRRLLIEFREECEAEGTPCWLCGLPIDFSAGQFDEGAFERDHFYPVSTHPDLQDDPENFRAAHRRCNSARGNKDPRPGLGVTSNDWFAGFGK